MTGIEKVVYSAVGVVRILPRPRGGGGINLEVTPGVERLPTSGPEPVFVPKEQWRAVDAEGIGCHASGGEIDAPHVFVLEPPEALLSELRGKLNASPRAGLDVRGIGRELSATGAGIEGWINDAGLPFGLRLMGSNVALHGPGQRSTAYDTANREFRGLHIDDHEKLPLDRRDDGFLLFNINLGVSERYFQFVNRTVRGLLDVLHAGRQNAPGTDMTVKDLKTLFFTRYPHYPVLRVRLRPLQAYLCQTQNIIHDGATNHSGHPDVSYLVAFRAVRGGGP
jgi:hypothetical protein